MSDLRVPTAAEYAAMVRSGRTLVECCRILQCGRDDLLRMAGGLDRSNQMLRGEIPVDEASLPKRWRKPFKRARRSA